MDSIVNKLTEIEDAASAIVQHAEDQKDVLDKEFSENAERLMKSLNKRRRIVLMLFAAGSKRRHPVFSTARVIQARRRYRLFRKSMRTDIRNTPTRY